MKPTNKCEVCGYGWDAPVKGCPNDSCPNFNNGWRITDVGCSCTKIPHTAGCVFYKDPTNKEQVAYKFRDHAHCWDQNQPPACGRKGTHLACCLCGITLKIADAIDGAILKVEEGWEKSLRKEAILTGSIDAQGYAEGDFVVYLNDAISFIRQLLAKNIEHCSEPECPECNVAAYEAGRKAVVEELLAQMPKERDEFQGSVLLREYSRGFNVALHAVLDLVSKLTNEK